MLRGGSSSQSCPGNDEDPKSTARYCLTVSIVSILSSDKYCNTGVESIFQIVLYGQDVISSKVYRVMTKKWTGQAANQTK